MALSASRVGALEPVLCPETVKSKIRTKGRNRSKSVKLDLRNLSRESVSMVVVVAGILLACQSIKFSKKKSIDDCKR